MLNCLVFASGMPELLGGERSDQHKAGGRRGREGIEQKCELQSLTTEYPRAGGVWVCVPA